MEKERKVYSEEFEMFCEGKTIEYMVVCGVGIDILFTDGSSAEACEIFEYGMKYTEFYIKDAS